MNRRSLEHRTIELMSTDSRLSDIDPELTSAVQENVRRAMDEIAWSQDKLVFRLAIGALGLVALIATSSALYMSNVPEGLVALGSTAVGGLVGLFARPGGAG